MTNETRLVDACQLRDKQRVEENDGKLTPVVLYADIVNAPTVDAVEAVHGRWIANRICSVCRKELSEWAAQNGYQYCPNCGAKMDR